MVGDKGLSSCLGGGCPVVPAPCVEPAPLKRGQWLTSPSQVCPGTATKPGHDHCLVSPVRGEGRRGVLSCEMPWAPTWLSEEGLCSEGCPFALSSYSLFLSFQKHPSIMPSLPLPTSLLSFLPSTKKGSGPTRSQASCQALGTGRLVCTCMRLPWVR